MRKSGMNVCMKACISGWLYVYVLCIFTWGSWFFEIFEIWVLRALGDPLYTKCPFDINITVVKVSNTLELGWCIVKAIVRSRRQSVFNVSTIWSAVVLSNPLVGYWLNRKNFRNHLYNQNFSALTSGNFSQTKGHIKFCVYLFEKENFSFTFP